MYICNYSKEGIKIEAFSCGKSRAMVIAVPACGCEASEKWRKIHALGSAPTLDGWMNQAYSRLSTTHGHITDCKLLVCMY